MARGPQPGERYSGVQMEFGLDEGKETQAAGFLIRLQGARMNGTALIKLLYLADRRSLAETGAPITGHRTVSMPRGPALSGVYDRTKEPARDGSTWHAWIAPDGQIATLQAVHNEHGRKTWQQLRELTHKLPEWDDPDGSSLPIDPERILEAVGKKPGE